MDLLRNIPLFKDLSGIDFANLEKITQVVAYPAGQVIFREGDESDSFYVIKSGSVYILKNTKPDGTGGEEISTLGPGDFFGEMGVIDDTPRTATSRTKEDCQLLKVKKTDFNNLLALNPGIAKKIMVTITQRLRPDNSSVHIAPPPPVSRQQRREGKIVVINSMTGGSGVTTLVCNLGYELQKVSNGKVILVDGSIQFNDLPVFLDIIPKLTLQQLAEETEVTMEMLSRGYINSTNFSVDFLAAPIKPEYAEAVTNELLRFVLNILRHEYDFVVVDTYSMMQEPILTLLELADEILYLMTPDIPSMKNTRLWHELIRALEFPEDKIHVVLSKYDKDYGVEPDAIEAKLQSKLFGILPYEYEHTIDCINKGVLLSVAFPKTPLTLAIQALARKIAKPGEELDTSSGGGWLGGLKKRFLGS